MTEQATPTSPDRQESPAPDYGAFYYRHDCGDPYERNERWLKFFAAVADGIVRDLHPISVLDAGCAMGFLVEELRKRGVDASGIDVSEYAISQVHESVAEHCRVASLTEPLSERYDLITCVEVLEHLPPEESGAAIANLCGAGDRILLSTTPEDFGEATHLNVQPPEAWSAAMAQHGFYRDLDQDLSYLTPWATLYVRREEPQVETVRRYDRSWFRLRREVAAVRGSLLKSQRQVAELEAGAESEASERPQLLRELDERNQEILKLRDLLIGIDAELGTARGRAAELEARTLRLTSAKQKLDARLPLFGKLVRGLSGLLRGN
jgi:SAM-dependent methyltransferase